MIGELKLTSKRPERKRRPPYARFRTLAGPPDGWQEQVCQRCGQLMRVLRRGSDFVMQLHYCHHPRDAA